VSYYYNELGDTVEYSPDKPIIHFASSPQQIESALEIARLRSNGFLLTNNAKEQS